MVSAQLLACATVSGGYRDSEICMIPSWWTQTASGETSSVIAILLRQDVRICDQRRWLAWPELSIAFPITVGFTP